MRQSGEIKPGSPFPLAARSRTLMLPETKAWTNAGSAGPSLSPGARTPSTLIRCGGPSNRPRSVPALELPATSVDPAETIAMLDGRVGMPPRSIVAGLARDGTSQGPVVVCTAERPTRSSPPPGRRNGHG